MQNVVSGNHVEEPVKTRDATPYNRGPAGSLMNKVLTRRSYHLERDNGGTEQERYYLVPDNGEGARYYVGKMGDIYLTLNHIGWVDDDGNVT